MYKHPRRQQKEGLVLPPTSLPNNLFYYSDPDSSIKVVACLSKGLHQHLLILTSFIVRPSAPTILLKLANKRPNHAPLDYTEKSSLSKSGVLQFFLGFLSSYYFVMHTMYVRKHFNLQKFRKNAKKQCKSQRLLIYSEQRKVAHLRRWNSQMFYIQQTRG